MANTSVVKQIVDAIKDSNNVLVTVNTNPTVDELSAALGITLLINKLDKHATAVFSGDIPSVIGFLNPEKTFENTVDSLRDFIIALDKEKADHLRYKVDGDMVKIFITPYRTTISQNDLDFSQGDYNVETVIAIGVTSDEDLDRALESHGRILHDATVATITLGEETKLGGIEWSDKRASSYSELLYMLADSLRNGKSLIDEQIANAFLTGIVAATDRFSNAKTSSSVMSVAAQLMSDGANQQLIATKLESGREITPQTADSHSSTRTNDMKPIEEMPDRAPKQEDRTAGNGSLMIDHMPKGTLEEITEQVQRERSEQALSEARDELARETTPRRSTQQASALLDDAMSSQPGIPSVVDLQHDIAQENDRINGTIPTPRQQWGGGRTTNEMEQPMLGGTLNATTEQAAEDARRAIEEDRNKTLLSHGGNTYSNVAPAYQSPINAVAGGVDAEPKAPDVFEGEPDRPTSRSNPSLVPFSLPSQAQPQSQQQEAIPPNDQNNHIPTLAEIDAQNRAHSDARAAIDAALHGGQTQSTGENLPPLPPLPPMPDFSTLPPLPGEQTPDKQAEQVSTISDTLGSVLPPPPSSERSNPSAPPDPFQFRIPGQ